MTEVHKVSGIRYSKQSLSTEPQMVPNADAALPTEWDIKGMGSVNTTKEALNVDHGEQGPTAEVQLVPNDASLPLDEEHEHVEPLYVAKAALDDVLTTLYWPQ